MLKRLSYIVCCLAILSGCSPKDFDFGNGPLSFSSQVITFDSLFTTFDSPTERLMVFNNDKEGILINRIYLEKGSASEFTFIFDGIASTDISNYELNPDDSVTVFISYTSDRRDELATDRIIFELNGTTQAVNLEAFVMDAQVWRDTVLFGFQTLDPNKRHLIDGYLLVADGAQLTIPAGTQLYFTPRQDENFNFISRLEVWGRLYSNGTWANKVVMQQTRTGEDYEETPGQWRGVRFYRTAKGCEMTHTLIKNAVIGIEVDSIADAAFRPKLFMDRCEVRNMAGYGVLGLGFSNSLGNRLMIEAQGCLFHNCSEGTTYLLGGGNYKFTNCTMANYTIDFNRSAPQLGIANYYEDENDIGYEFPMKAEFHNCIVWGSEEDEVVIDTALNDSFWDVNFYHCTLRSTIPLVGENNLFNADPLFESPTAGNVLKRSYRLREGSTSNNTGKDVSAYNINLDLDDQVWTVPYDRGAFQLRP